jgi:hypothetical protein
MFVTEETTPGLLSGWAVAQMGSTIESGWSGEVSDHAYAAGLAVLARAGPLGDVRGLAKTVQVRLSGPRERKTGVACALRWEASGPAGGLFSVLDRLLLSRIARTTLRSLLDSVAREMTQPARTSARRPARSARRPVRSYAQVEPPYVRPERS